MYLEKGEVDTEKEEQNFDYETFFKNFHIKDGHHSRFENREVVKTTKGPIELVEYIDCPECQYPIKANDPHRAESVCESCGVVLETHELEADSNFFINRSTAKLPENDKTLRKDEKKIIAKLTGKKYHTDKQEWRLNQYYHYRDKTIKYFKMRDALEFIFISILNKYSLKKIHSRLNYEAIITGIALEILRRNGRVVPYSNKFVQESGLNKKHQQVIRRNLYKLGVFE